MSNPVAIHAREVRPHEHATRLFGVQQVDACSTSRQAEDPACRGPQKLPESSGFDSNRRVIWGIPVKMNFVQLFGTNRPEVGCGRVAFGPA